MKIEWNIEKKRGNFRPLLRYQIYLEEYEMSLAMHSINMESTLPILENPHENFCLPQHNERKNGWNPKEFHWLSTPYFRDGQKKGSLRLPFRECGNYPEVRESFKRLREHFEKEVQKAYQWQPLQDDDYLEMSENTKDLIVASVASEKLLSLWG